MLDYGKFGVSISFFFSKVLEQNYLGLAQPPALGK